MHNDDNITPSAALLDVVIVNWNSGALLADCLQALAASSIAISLHVYVVDNASHDASWRAAEAPRDGLRVTLMRNDANIGFGAACNQAAFVGMAPHILFLNPDTRVFADTLQAALAFARQPFAGARPPGIIGVAQVDSAGTVQRTCASMPTPGRLLGRAMALDKIAPALVTPHFMTGWDHRDTREVAQVMGAFLLIERALFTQLQGFDERFFVYYEDLDLCVRAASAGRSVVHYADTTVWHQGQGTTVQVKDQRLFYIWRSEILFAAKHFGSATAAGVLTAQVMAQTPLRLVQTLVQGQRGGWRHVLRATGLLLRDVPAIAGKISEADTARRAGAT